VVKVGCSLKYNGFERLCRRFNLFVAAVRGLTRPTLGTAREEGRIPPDQTAATQRSPTVSDAFGRLWSPTEALRGGISAVIDRRYSSQGSRDSRPTVKSGHRSANVPTFGTFELRMLDGSILTFERNQIEPIPPEAFLDAQIKKAKKS
jgi:hypothetical protein